MRHAILLICGLLLAPALRAQYPAASASPGASTPASASPEATAPASASSASPAVPAAAASPSASPASPAPSPSASPASGPPDIDALRKKLAADPKDVATMRMLGTVLRKMGREKEALPLLLHACHLQPKDPRVRAQLAMLLNSTGKPKAAHHHYEILKKLDPALADMVLKLLAR